MFFRWYNADLVTFFMWDWNDRVGSRMTPRLRTTGDGVMEQPSTTRSRSSTFLSSDLGATTMSSVLLLFGLRRLEVIQDFSSCRQLMSGPGGS